MLDRFVIAIESIAASLAVIAARAPSAAAPASTPPPSDAPQTQAPPRGRGRPPKQPPAEPAAAAPVAAKDTKADAPKPEAAPVAAQVEQAKPAVTAPAPDFDYEVLRAAVVELVNVGSEGKAAAINVLTKHGVKKASEAAPSEWAAIHADMVAELAILQGGDGDIA